MRKSKSLKMGKIKTRIIVPLVVEVIFFRYLCFCVPDSMVLVFLGVVIFVECFAGRRVERSLMNSSPA
jgi:hypothetical protein